MSEEYFFCGSEQTEYLKNKDPILGTVIDEVGLIKRPVIVDMFSALVNAIVGQQISSKAQATIWGRILDRFTPMNAERIYNASTDELQNCGISFRKAEYIKELAFHIYSGKLDLDSLNVMTDENVCNILTQIKGIGEWTAEMLLIFSLKRPDVFSFNDLAIHRGLRMIYHHRKITRQLFEKYRRQYSPYATTASFYIWEVASGAYLNFKDYAPQNSVKKRK